MDKFCRSFSHDQTGIPVKNFVIFDNNFDVSNKLTLTLEFVAYLSLILRG